MNAPPGTLRVVATVAVLGVAVHLLLPRLANLDASLSVVRSLRPWPLAGAVAAQALSYWASGVMMRRIARAAGGRLSTGRGVAITLAAGSVGLVAWGALGFAGAAWRWARDGGAGRAGARLCAWLPTVLNAAVVAAAATVGMAELLALGRLTRAEVLAFAASLAAIAAAWGALAWSARHPRRAEAAVRRLRRAGARLLGSSIHHAGAGPDSVAVPADPRAWRGPLLHAALAMGFDLACLELLFISARAAPGVGVLLAGYGLPLLVGKVAVVPGGLGVVEGGMVGMYHALGLPAATAVTVVLAYRLLSFWLPNLIGFGVMPWLEGVTTPGERSTHGRRSRCAADARILGAAPE